MRALHLFLTALALCAANPAAALYKVVGPDGRVTYTDQPPPAQAPAASQIRTGSAAPEAGSALPYELKQVASRFPVTLYTKDDCAPCGLARSHLRERGIPFAEKLVNSPADVEAYQRTEGTSTVPLLRVGGQQLKGYAGSEWTAYLDAAGYPARSALPPGYRAPAAQPLVAREAVVPDRAGAKAGPQAERAEPVEAPLTTASPATPVAPRPGLGGIRF